MTDPLKTIVEVPPIIPIIPAASDAHDAEPVAVASDETPEMPDAVAPNTGIGSGAGAQNNGIHANSISADDPSAINNNLTALADGSMLLRL